MNRKFKSKLFSRAGRADHMAAVEEVQVVPVVVDNKLGRAGQGPYNPRSKATVQLNVLTSYFSEAAGVYTEMSAAALAAAQPTLVQQLPVFLFANLDYDAGYATFQSQFPISNWRYQPPIIYGLSTYVGTELNAFDATVKAKFRAGDVIFPYLANVGGTDYLCVKVLRLSNGAYSTLLGSTSSNIFAINMLRMTAADDTAAQLAQFANAIMLGDLTMFGKFTKDTIDPDSYKNPEQQQKNIVDVYYDFRVSKQRGMAIYFNFDVVQFRLNIFIADAFKVD